MNIDYECYATADAALCVYVNYCHGQYINIAKSRAAVLGAQFTHRAFRTHLPRAWVALRSWQMQVPRRLRVPLPLDILQAFFITGWILVGRRPGVRATRLLICCVVLARLAFYALLRPGERMPASRCRT